MTGERGAPCAETSLTAKLKNRIRRDGPLSVADYMTACLHDPEYGYYRRQPAIGAGGDFVTAPEISQVFGELIGLWCAVVWQQMGSPTHLNLMELGPGRGTLMRDALRAGRVVSGFRDALSVHLVDSNETLRAIQQETLSDCGVPIHFHAEPSNALMMRSQVAEGPTIVIGNEFLDTLPVEQFEYAQTKWRDRDVAIDENDRLNYKVDMTSGLALDYLPETLVPQEGDVFEISVHHHVYADVLLKARAELGPLAALFIDYGHTATGFGDTLQGVAGQKYVSPFHAPGESDLSAQVDFQHFADECARAGLSVDGPLSQAEFLGRLGIIERASRLMAANPAKASTIEAGVARLLAPTGMGSRFLALGVRSAGLPALPGFG
jgi:NADH dehydrogenase [ubiquinone] 1 alpha subcomplex assembly factor 7